MKTARVESLVPAGPRPYASALPRHELSSQALYQAEGGGAGVKFVQERGPFRLRQKRMVETCLRKPDQVHGVEAHAMRVDILVVDGRFKHGRIVNDEYVHAHRM